MRCIAVHRFCIPRTTDTRLYAGGCVSTSALPFVIKQIIHGFTFGGFIVNVIQIKIQLGGQVLSDLILQIPFVHQNDGTFTVVFLKGCFNLFVEILNLSRWDVQNGGQTRILQSDTGRQRAHTHDGGLVIGDVHGSNAAEVLLGFLHHMIYVDTLGRANFGGNDKLTVVK